jgi:hypothetical protein
MTLAQPWLAHSASMQAQRFAAALALLTAPFAAPARAEFLITLNEASATSEYFWETSPGGFQRQDSQMDVIELPEFSAFAEVENLAGGRAAAYQDLYGINAVFAESQNALEDALKFHARAESKYDINVSTPTRETGQAVFKFVINGGELRLENFAAVSEGAGGSTARVSADISVFPGGFWRLDWALEKFFGAPEVFDFSIESFGIGFPPITLVVDGDDVVVTIPHFEGETLLDRDDFKFGVHFSYTMMAELDLNDLSVGGLAGIGDPFSLSMGGPSTDGIEFFLDGVPLSSFAIIPEPASSALLIGFGAILLCFYRTAESHSPNRALS